MASQIEHQEPRILMMFRILVQVDTLTMVKLLVPPMTEVPDLAG
jgi:hypothetical protein